VAFDIFLKFAGGAQPIEGESVNDKHKNEIDVLSFSWGESRDGATADPQELAFVTPLSVASPLIAEACALGTQIQTAQLSVNNASVKGTAELLMIKLSNVTVGSYQLAIAETDPQATDRFTLAFQSINIVKGTQSATGSIGAGTEVTIEFPPPAL
jgi:type VI secretion system secreted protein Hcp